MDNVENEEKMNNEDTSSTFFTFPTFVAGFHGAWNFLTIVPLGKRATRVSPWAPAWFAVIGTLLGGMLFGLHQVMWGRVPLAVEAALWVVLLTVVTGGIHLDALADMVDGLYGPADREERLRRMKDPHVGAMGVVAIGLSLLVKAASCWALAAHRDPWAVLVAPTWGRGVMALTMGVLPYIGTASGTGAPFVTSSLKAGILIGVAWMMIVAGGILGVHAWVVILFAGTAWWGMILLVRRRLGGVTGDVIGGVGELVESVSWAVVATMTCGGL